MLLKIKKQLLIFYSENTYLLTHSIVHTRKVRIKLPAQTMYPIYNNYYISARISMYIPTNKKVHNKFNISYKLVLSCFTIITYTNFFKVQGIGFKYNTNVNLLFFKTGYSHLIFFLINLEVYLKRKTKLIFCMESRSKYILHSLSAYIKKLKIPNLYTGKGIRKKGDVIRTKKGKVNQI